MGFVYGQSGVRVHVHRLERACSVTVHEEVIGAHEDHAVSIGRAVADLAKPGRRRDEGIGLAGCDDEQALLGPANKKRGDFAWFSTVAECSLPFIARSMAGDFGDGADSPP
ncbi:BQ5605_C007g04620 [Microbotryum silenes-dioicae]|uniref:BQ5605_C007g04620 protein n=1 Tax=Microbotryum silenes-dioicae TaxID=796604 RepID=A0A2X0M7K4_9BASI|nr:BQ5605_C007g04620 [Microbotryum silenes-dioicae]